MLKMQARGVLRMSNPLRPLPFDCAQDEGELGALLFIE